jgi:hypothetical protein
MSSVKTTRTLVPSLPGPSREQLGFTKLFALCLLIPFAAVSATLTLSPNFNLALTSEVAVEIREHPVGGDILQEYVGGHLFASDSDRLYDWKHSATLQHDAELIGFEWDKSGYFPMIYPPFHYQIASLGAGMSYEQFVVASMYVVATALSIAALIFLLGYRELRKGAGGWFFFAILFTPLLLSINMGQKSAILLSILTVTFVLLHRERPFIAGLVFGLIAIKPYMAIPIGIAMLCKKQYCFVAGAVLTLSVLIAVSLCAAPGTWTEYIQVCLEKSGNYVTFSGYQLEHSHSLWGAMQLLLGERNPALVKPIAIVAAIAVVTLLGRILSGPVELSSNRFAYQFSALVVATVLISPHFYTYDLTILLLPLAICGLSFEATRQVNQRMLYYVCLAVLFGASFYEPVASRYGFQVSTVIFLAWLVLLAGGWSSSDQRTALEKTAAK